MADETIRPVVAGSSPSTLTIQCRVKMQEQPLGACSSAPGPDQLRKLNATHSRRSPMANADTHGQPMPPPRRRDDGDEHPEDGVTDQHRPVPSTGQPTGRKKWLARPESSSREPLRSKKKPRCLPARAKSAVASIKVCWPEYASRDCGSDAASCQSAAEC
jgi:hypothetical protein